MDLSGLLPALLADPAAAQAVDHVVATATGRDADELANALRCYLPYDDVAVLPSWETLPHERLSPRSDTVAKRVGVFRRLAHPGVDGPTGKIRVLVMPVRALLQPVVAGLGELEPVEINVGDRVNLDEATQRLSDAAYQRVDMVEKRGEFAVRGGILDVFPPTESHPLRVELWGEDVEEIRWFSVADQRSLEVAEHGVWAPPCREILLTDAVRERALELIPQLPAATDMLDRLGQGIAVEGMESLAPVLVDRMVPVLDLVRDDSLLVLVDPERVRRRAHDLVATTQEFLEAAWTSAAAGAATPLDLSAASFASFAEIRALSAVRGLGWWTLSPFSLDVDATEAAKPDDFYEGSTGTGHTAARNEAPHLAAMADDLAATAQTLVFGARDVERYRGEVARAVADVRVLQQAGWRLVLATEGHGPAQRMVEQLKASEVPARLVTRIV